MQMIFGIAGDEEVQPRISRDALAYSSFSQYTTFISILKSLSLTVNT